MTTLSDALNAYKICAKAEGKSPCTVRWVVSSVGYFMDFLGGDREITGVTADDLRRFILALQESHKFRHHRFNRPLEQKLSPQAVQTYARAVRAFFGYLYREGLIEANPMSKVKTPKVPEKVVSTLTERELEKLLSQPDRHSPQGYRDFALILTFVDSGARLSEICGLRMDDVDLLEGYLKVLGKGGRERLIPIGRKVCQALLKYRLRYRPEALVDNFFVTRTGNPLSPNRVEKIIRAYGKEAGLKRVYPHLLRHSSSVAYVRNGGDPFSLQKKLGHRTLLMTRHYCELGDRDVKAAHMRHGVVDRLRV